MTSTTITWNDVVRKNIPLSDIKEGSQEYDAMKIEAENGNAPAQHSLGMWNENVAKDFDEAKKWYKRASEQGHDGAQEAYNDLIAKLKSENI